MSESYHPVWIKKEKDAMRYLYQSKTEILGCWYINDVITESSYLMSSLSPTATPFGYPMVWKVWNDEVKGWIHDSSISISPVMAHVSSDENPSQPIQTTTLCKVLGKESEGR